MTWAYYQNRWRFFVAVTKDMDAVTVFDNRLANLGVDVAGTHK